MLEVLRLSPDRTSSLSVSRNSPSQKSSPYTLPPPPALPLTVPALEPAPLPHPVPADELLPPCPFG